MLMLELLLLSVVSESGAELGLMGFALALLDQGSRMNNGGTR